MDIDTRIERLKTFKARLRAWHDKPNDETREWLNLNRGAVEREVTEAGCLKLITISPPPAVGGLMMRNVNAFDLMYDRPYLMSLVPIIGDMIDLTIAELLNPSSKESRAVAQVVAEVQKGYAFVAMAIDENDHQLVDVLEAIKEASKDFGIAAERVDDVESNDRITDRILESIRKAEYVFVDLTLERSFGRLDLHTALGKRQSTSLALERGFISTLRTIQ
ncbi:hypothetical protein ACWAUC_14980 [Bradyrhizobium guangdongense]